MHRQVVLSGRFDGPLGVLVALACVQHLHETKSRLPFAIEVVGFADEEGTDCKAAHEGYISVTPLQVDLTDYKLLLNSTLPSFSWP